MPTIRFSTSGREVSFPEGDEVNLLRIAIRNECGIPFKCASGNCGTDRVRVEDGLENCLPMRRRERERLAELVEQGYRLACQTYVKGDVTVAWDPDQVGLDEGSRVYDKLRQVWLSKDDSG
ncbi:MAG TPA: 2Fe-2S iron-sulfur cluster binding domain-containing protein [Ilumatobacteraceae bacterium]|nr:2Fe-2S iron-sulfur cluster binding domain-containing protein [Ilumatobacteraceae bacterium]